MKNRSRIIAFLIIAGIGYVLIRAIFPSYSWHQKITVEIESQKSIRSGSAVSWVKWTDSPRILPDGSTVGSHFKGEATVVEVGDGKYLFALIGGGRHVAPFEALASLKTDRITTSTGHFNGASKVRKRLSGKVIPLIGRSRPLLVTFEDITKPETVKRVDPEDLDASFGLCADGSGLRDADAPWRAKGLTWRNWVRKQREDAARQKAMSEAGIASELEVVLLGLKHFWQWNYGGFEDSEAKKIKAIGSEVDKQKRYRLIASRDKHLDKSDIIPRDKSNDCYRLKSVALEITNEPVTNDKVESLLGWLSKHPEPKLGPATGRTKNIPFYRRVAHGDFIRR